MSATAKKKNPFETGRNRRSKKGVIGQRVKGSHRDVRASRERWLSLRNKEASGFVDRRIDSDLDRFQKVRTTVKRRREGAEEDLPETFVHSFDVENSEDVEELVERQKKARTEAQENAAAVADIDKEFGELTALLGFRSSSRKEGNDDYDTSLRQLALEKRVSSRETRSDDVRKNVGPYDRARLEYLSTPRAKDLVEFFVVERLRDCLDLRAGNAAIACAKTKPDLVCRAILDAVSSFDPEKLVGNLLVARLVTRLPLDQFTRPLARRMRLKLLPALRRSHSAQLASCALREIDLYLDEWTPELRDSLSRLEMRDEETDALAAAATTTTTTLVPETSRRERDEVKDLKRKVKREHRAAMRELRKDANYTNATRAKSKSDSISERRAERQKNMAWLQTQRQRGWEP